MKTRFHPSEYIREELDARGWTIEKLAIAMGGPDIRVNLLSMQMYLGIGPENEDMRLGDNTAAQLGVAFGVSPELFLNLERRWLDTGAGQGEK